MTHSDIALFALGASRSYGEKVAAALGTRLTAHEEREFEDGEHKARPLENIRGKDAYVVHSLYGDPQQSVNDKLCRLLFFLGAVREAAADRVTAIVPYLCYARKDRKTKLRDPVTTRYVAALLEAVGIDRVVTVDVHNLAAYQNAFRCASEHLEARMLFVGHFAPILRDRETIVLSPDEGGLKRADAFRRALSAALSRQVPIGFMEKRRSRGVVSGESLFADVKDRVVLIIDDLVSTGGTLLRAALASRERGARDVYAAASHGLFVGGASQILSGGAIDRLVITDTVPAFRLDQTVAAQRVVTLETASLVAEAIKRMHDGGSIAELLGPED